MFLYVYLAANHFPWNYRWRPDLLTEWKDPGNAPVVVDFLSDILFAGALTPAERQSAIDFLNTDDNGVPAAYTTTRIKDLVGFLLGYPQFQEQ
jgi:hypothetical protein